jgi:membrane-associated HD superfamily phosphohydrolase
MMKTRILFSAILILLFTGCAELMKVLQTAGNLPLTEAEVISGLKEALNTGARNAAERLARENGYYGDDLIKILLPDEAKIIVDNISRIPGGDKLVEDVIIRINRAAEDAAKEVAPIFVSSVTQMTIKDAFGILNGADNAATNYLRSTTYNELYSLYKPKIQTSTEKKIVGNISTKDSWNTLTSKWNSLANSIAGKLANLKPVNTDLDDFLTNKALSGMFLKVETEELKIRKDISTRVTPILQRVFGSLDNKAATN